MNMDLSKLYEKIKELYVKYLQTGLSISNPIIAEERKNLYKNIKYNALWHEPFIEYIPKYIEYKSISECAKELQCYNKFDEFIIASKLFNEDMKLYKHQYNSLKEVMNKKHVVITTGTSSGKTESFILPMYYNLLKSNLIFTTAESTFGSGKKSFLDTFLVSDTSEIIFKRTVKAP